MAAKNVPPADDSGSRSPDILGAIISTYCIAVLAIVLRTAGRMLSKARFWIDDWLIYAGMILYTGILALIIETVHCGIGRHIQIVPLAGFKTILILFYAANIITPWVSGLVRCSILVFYWRIFHIGSIRRPIFIVATMVIAYYFSLTLLFAFQCDPPNKFWNRSTSGHCRAFQPYFVGITIPAVIIDIAILMMPLPYIWNLKMKLRQKLLLSIVFVLGGCASVSSILQLWVLMMQVKVLPDWTYMDANPAIWPCVEASLAITSACLPSSWPVFTAIGVTFRKFSARLSKKCIPDSFQGNDFAIHNVKKESSDADDNTKLHPGANIMHHIKIYDPSHTSSNEINDDRPRTSQDWE